MKAFVNDPVGSALAADAILMSVEVADEAMLSLFMWNDMYMWKTR